MLGHLNKVLSTALRRDQYARAGRQDLREGALGPPDGHRRGASAAFEMARERVKTCENPRNSMENQQKR